MIYDLTVVQTSKMLKNLSTILEKSVGFAESKKIEMEVLLNSRLAADQFNLIRQVQIACDTAKNGVARLAGKADLAPKHEDNEKTLAELLVRINSVVEYLATFTPQDLAEAANIQVTQPRWQGKQMNGNDFAIQYVMPNVYFHVTTAYSILRHNGVEVGKRDYLGTLPYIV